MENKNNLKKTWQIINQLLSKSKIKIKNQFFIDNELISDDAEISNHFNTYFSTIVENLVKKIPWTAAKFADFLPQPTLNTIFFKPSSAEEIQSIITTMKPKSSCGIDDIPSKVIKFTPNNILKALSHIFNLSLFRGKFIEHFKTAKIISIYKKGDYKNITNNRPISLLSCFSKLLEKIVQGKKMISFINTSLASRSTILLNWLQHTNLVNKITAAMESNETTLGVFLDLSKAFDIIYHNILLTKLYHCGIRGTAYNWFSSYSYNRKQITKYGDALSNSSDAKFGVLLGSILESTLFLFYDF